MDVTDMVNYNVEILNPTDLASSFFCLSKTDPSVGFTFDASKVAGQTYPDQVDTSSGKHGQFLFQVFVPGAEFPQYLQNLSKTLRRMQSFDAALYNCCLRWASRRTSRSNFQVPGNLGPE